jgi:hypothetical protein
MKNSPIVLKDISLLKDKEIEILLLNLLKNPYFAKKIFLFRGLQFLIFLIIFTICIKFLSENYKTVFIIEKK